MKDNGPPNGAEVAKYLKKVFISIWNPHGQISHLENLISITERFLRELSNRIGRSTRF